jgi:hypothetical protein
VRRNASINRTSNELRPLAAGNVKSPSTPSAANPRLSRLRPLALVGGCLAGLLIGMVAAAPQFYSWPAGRSIAVVAGGAVLGTLVGWFALSIALGLHAGQPEDKAAPNPEGHREAVHGYAEVVSMGESESAP